DEPFSALDAQTKLLLQQNFGETIMQSGVTTLLITHDLSEAVFMADRILVLSERPATVIEEIVVDLPTRGNLMERRKSPKASEYIGRLFELLKLESRAI
ncbi:MAG: ABC transporter ATP-binding protein, partial [Oceanospirillaceae bacterium]|nr:ABC transporter ATP-binding protein [Oceanospirillaceae bacterium]